MAGLSGDVESWNKFEWEWRKILSKYNLSHFHAKKMAHRQDEHKGWSRERVRHCWADLLYVMQEQELFISKTVLHREIYLKKYIELIQRGKRERLDSAYALCFRSILYSLPRLFQRRYQGDKINFVLEAGHRNAQDAVRVFNEFVTNHAVDRRNSVGSFSIINKLDSPALQAADMLAYWIYRDLKHPDIWSDDTVDFIPEFELRRAGLNIYEHLISEQDLVLLRANYYAKGALERHIFCNSLVSKEALDSAGVPIFEKTPPDDLP